MIILLNPSPPLISQPWRLPQTMTRKDLEASIEDEEEGEGDNDDDE
jgi:hypothetical protein